MTQQQLLRMEVAFLNVLAAPMRQLATMTMERFRMMVPVYTQRILVGATATATSSMNAVYVAVVGSPKAPVIVRATFLMSAAYVVVMGSSKAPAIVRAMC